ncbi:hypothetical protein SETIT_8G241000v2 [Setaria italica]|uniref:Uncharacterized protein n=1 Tax=Setaria italica TaxID=4555 RepID=A0A368SB31_SETIT|nr:hypothetical protein SETIT_8G241000v2 [Setaria italica]
MEAGAKRYSLVPAILGQNKKKSGVQHLFWQSETWGIAHVAYQYAFSGVPFPSWSWTNFNTCQVVLRNRHGDGDGTWQQMRSLQTRRLCHDSPIHVAVRGVVDPHVPLTIDVVLPLAATCVFSQSIARHGNHNHLSLLWTVHGSNMGAGIQVLLYLLQLMIR